MEHNKVKNRTVNLRLPNVDRYRKYDKGNTLLHTRASPRNLEEIKKLFFSTIEGDLDEIKKSLESDEILVIKNKFGSTLLHYATWFGELSIVKYLVERGADLKTKDNYDQNLLHAAAWNGHLELVKFFLKQGLSSLIEDKDQRGNTPLLSAARNSRLETVKYLISKGADIEAKDNEGNTALHVVVFSHSRFEKNPDGKPFVRALLNGKANINAEDNAGNTPLHIAAEYANIELVQYLIKKGANSEAKNAEGKTPLDFAEAEAGAVDHHSYDIVQRYTKVVKIFRGLEKGDNLSPDGNFVSNEDVFSSDYLLENSSFQTGAKPKLQVMAPASDTPASDTFGMQELNDSLTSFENVTRFFRSTPHSQAEVSPFNLSLTPERGLADNLGMNTSNVHSALFLANTVLNSRKNYNVSVDDELNQVIQIIDATEQPPFSSNMTAKPF